MVALSFCLMSACGSNSKVPENGGETVVVGAALDQDLDGDKLICRRQRVVGSYTPVEVCKTEAELAWDREHAIDSVGTLGSTVSNVLLAPTPPAPKN